MKSLGRWLCGLLSGHHYPEYFRQSSIIVDGIGRHHLFLWRECEDCGCVDHAVVHLPKMYVDAVDAVKARGL